MQNLTRILRDGYIQVLAGMDSGRAPNVLLPNQCAMLINLTVRGGYPETRSGFKGPRSLRFESTEIATWYKTKQFQGEFTYTPLDGNAFKVASIGGRLFKIDILDDYKVTDITPLASTQTVGDFISPPQGTSIAITVISGDGIEVGFPLRVGNGSYDVTLVAGNTITMTNLNAEAGILITSGAMASFLSRNKPNLPLAWMEQAEQYLIVQDGQGKPIIFDGASSRRAANAGEVPTGTAMKYWNGRLWVAVNGNQIAAGDIAGGPTSVIAFTETTYLAEGGKLRVPGNFGKITALVALPVLDTSTGQGPLLVLTASSISSINLPVDRNAWKLITDPVQTLALVNYGAEAHVSTIVVNGDLFFRSKIGLMSFILARREFGTWGNVPVSREMLRILRNDSQRLLAYTSAVLFDNRLLFTTNPVPLGQGAYWKGLAVLDFDLVSSMGQKSPAAWEGMWTGLNIMGIGKGTFQGQERCFIYARNASNENELWEIDSTDHFDGDGGRIISVLETRSFDFQTPFDLKRLWACEQWWDHIEGEVDFDLKYRSNGFPCWTSWGVKQLASKQQLCEDDVVAGTCLALPNYKPGYKTRLSYGQPPTSPETFDNRRMELGAEFQCRLQWEGHAQLKRVLIKAQMADEPEINPS